MNKIKPVLESSSHKIDTKLKQVFNKTIKNNDLEKQPIKDVFDFSMEEYGKYRIGDRIVSIIFPR